MVKKRYHLNRFKEILVFGSESHIGDFEGAALQRCRCKAVL